MGSTSSDQFYADNEQSTEGHEQNIDLSRAYEIKPPILDDEKEGDGEIMFFCPHCKKAVNVERKKDKKGSSFVCLECQKKGVSFGTKKSINHFFHLNDAGVQKS